MQKMEYCKTFQLNLTQFCLFFLALMTVSSCCFIRNCPPGGKRSMDIISRPGKECMACGPGLQGQCVGPDICCGPFGCHMGTSQSSVCEKENESTVPCAVSGPPCGSRNQGNCVADGICCDPGACSFNSKCKSNTEPKDVQIFSLLKALGLLETKAYNNGEMS
ncbi:terepressin/terephysin-like [Saccostrea echinata]|uniref:terepressin/terephysin-like n=1 Tax=Saccostrea echinata TaxID=191078 RepID=UPI002A803A6C|nr:terepressin/terephysin-like [Saccostrea echinata]